jgi:RNA ligase (TIGR02306 family)
MSMASQLAGLSKEWWIKRANMEGDYEIGAGVPEPLPETTRRLATVRKVDEVLPIEGADKIEAVRIDGWMCVVSKGEFSPGDLCVYFEIDSFLPVGESYPHFEFLRKRAIKWNGKDGCRIKTIRLRGQISQGIAMPLSAFHVAPAETQVNLMYLKEGDDVTAALQIEKWEKPIPAQLGGQVRGGLPAGIPKTDQERVQNMGRELSRLRENAPDTKFEVTIKLDGSSMTSYLLRDRTFGVCSRNFDLVRCEGNAFWDYALREKLEERFLAMADEFGSAFDGFAFQGELIGPGIQGNAEKLSQTELMVFDIYCFGGPIGQGYYRPADRRRVCAKYGFTHVPLVGIISLAELPDLNAFKEWSKGESLTPGVPREGVVFKATEDSSVHFKCINDEWLLANEQ